MASHENTRPGGKFPPLTVLAQYQGLIRKLANLQPADMTVLLSLFSRRGKDEKVFVGQKRVAEDTSLDLRTVKRSMQRLRETYWFGKPLLILEGGGTGRRDKFFPGVLDLCNDVAETAGNSQPKWLRSNAHGFERGTRAEAPRFRTSDEP